MVTPARAPRRERISATVDAELLHALTRFVREHAQETNLSRELDEAMRLWLKEKRRAAMRAQYQRARSPQECQERAAFRQMQHHAAQRLLRSGDRPDGGHTDESNTGGDRRA